MENQTCSHCGEAIAPGEASTAIAEPFHDECFFRIVTGSISHQLGKCRCYGGEWEDPPELTTREAARLALDYFVEHGPQ